MESILFELDTLSPACQTGKIPDYKSQPQKVVGQVTNSSLIQITNLDVNVAFEV